MAVEEIELRLTVDGRPAQKALDETRSMAERLGGGIDRLKTGFGEIQKRVQPAAAAISSVSSALGTMNGEAGKAVAAIGNVTAAFAAGGPYAAALAAGVVAVDALSQSWEKQLQRQDAVIASVFNVSQAYIRALNEARQRATSARAEFKEAARGGRELTPDERKKELEAEAAGRIAAAEAAVEQAKAQVDINKAQEVSLALEMTFSQARSLLEKQRTSNIRIAERALEVEKTTLQTRINAISVSTIMAKKAEEEAAQNEYLAEQINAVATATKATGRADGKKTGDASLTFLGQWKKEREAGLAAQREQEADDALEADISRMADAAKATRDFEQLKTEITRDYSDERGQIIAEEAEKQKAVIEQRNSMLAATAMGMASTLASASEQLLTDIITGQEHATERFAAFIMQQAGQALISNGVQLIGEGTKNLLIGNPMAAGQFVGAASLIGMGVSLGGIATGVTHAAAGGKFGQKVPEKSTSDRSSDPGARARPSSGRMGGDSGGQAITIIYGGISGPSADDGARALRRASRRADKRGFA